MAGDVSPVAMFFNAFKDLLQLEPGQSKGGQFLEDCVQGTPLVTHNDKNMARRIPCWRWQRACTTECTGTLRKVWVSPKWKKSAQKVFSPESHD